MTRDLLFPLLGAAALGATLGACKKPPERDGDRDPHTSPPIVDTAPSDTGPATTIDTATTATGTTGDTGAVEIDCAALLQPGPVSARPIVGARGFHDVAFDLVDLEIIGSDNTNLVQADDYGNASVFAVGTGLVQGIDRLPNGDFVAASDSNGSLMRITPAGGIDVIVGSIGAYGVVVGPDGMVYTANYEQIERIDPDTGDRETLLERDGLRPRTIAFGKGYTKLFIGTQSGNGDIYALDLDKNLDPVGPPYVYAQGVGTGAFHDGIAVDWCENVYVLDYSTDTMWRIEPDGTVTAWLDFPASTYGHGARWGPGIGTWRIDAIYVPQPYNGNTVAELVVGIPSATWTGTSWP